MEIKDKIKASRTSKKITQKELAEKIGVTQATITKIETGETKNPSVDIALKIASALGEDVFDLFGTESLQSISKMISDSDIAKLKDLVFESIFELRTNKEHFKMQELIERYGNETWVEKGADELMKYHGAIRDFYFGLQETLINKGFCTLDEIRNYNLRKSAPIPDDNKTEDELLLEIRKDVKSFVKEKGLGNPSN